MTKPLMPGMAAVAALTRAGKLTQATAQIQDLLRTRTAKPRARKTPQGADVLEGVFSAVSPVAKGAVPKTPLALTLGRIRRGGMPEWPRATVAPLAQPNFTTHAFSSPQGNRDYMLYVPASAPTNLRLPVVMMLHGCTQSPADFAAGTRMNTLAEAQHFIVIYPAQPSGANINKCWNWFRPADQRRDAGEPAILAAIARQVLASHCTDPTRVYVAGLSAGGAAAAILAQEYPDIFAAVGVHSGLASGSAHDVGSAFAAMRNGARGRKVRRPVPTIVFHGTADTTVAVENAQAVADQGLTGAAILDTGASASGRTYLRTTVMAAGKPHTELWLIDGAPHAWAGGSADGSFTDPAGPDASAAMARFFAQHRLEQ